MGEYCSWNKLAFFFFFLAVALAAMAAPAAARFSLVDEANILAAHNAARRDVGIVDKMAWDEKLAWLAHEHADRCRFEHMEIEGIKEWIGQNLFASTARVTASKAVDMWVKEKKYYNYDTNSCADGEVCGHYTQVVWRNSTSIGCARSRPCPNGLKYITVCYYRPGGNYRKQRPY